MAEYSAVGAGDLEINPQTPPTPRRPAVHSPDSSQLDLTDRLDQR